MSDQRHLVAGENPLVQRLCEEAYALFDQGDYALAHMLYEKAREISEAALGPDHLATARCLNGLARTLDEEGDAAAARPFAERALELRRKVLGDDHPDVGESLHTLAAITFDQGDFASGQKLAEQAFHLREKALGPGHPDTIESAKSLALMMAYQGNRTEAHKLLARSLEICERTLGEQHLCTARVVNGLGVILAADKRTYAGARAMYERSLAIYEQLLEPDHIDTARGLNNLAAVLADLGNHTQAQQILERSLAIHERRLGPKNPRLVYVLANLADIHRTQGHLAEAWPLLARALVIAEADYGPRHPQTIKILEKVVTLAGDQHLQGDRDALNLAMPLYQCLTSLQAASGALPEQSRTMPGAYLPPDQAAANLHDLVIRLEASLGRPPLTADDQATLESARSLTEQADLLYIAGDYAQAESLLQQALGIREQIYGSDHIDHVPLLERLAKTKRAQAQYSAVLPLVQRVADIHTHVLGPQHPRTVLAPSRAGVG